MTGPSSALTGIRVAAKNSKAEIHGLTEVTPRTIAYICVMVRQALSSARHWTPKDGVFNYESFYRLILKLFEGGGIWQAELLSFWNR